MSTDQDSIEVSIVVLPESTPTVPYGLYEVLATVGTTWTQVTGEASRAPRLVPRLVSCGREAFTSAIGLPIQPQAGFDEVDRSDVVIITDLAVAADADLRGRWPEACAWIRRQFEQGATVLSVCTGSLLLAEAGMLNGLEATTHWSVAELFRRGYPDVRLRAERILVPADPEHRVVTCGGQASWEDMALYLIARYCGEVEAVRTAKLFLFGDRSEGQLPFAAMSRLRRHEDAVIADCQAWIAEHYNTDNPVMRMVQRSGLPERSFKRRFRNATGLAPLEYVHALRIEEAKHMLEAGDRPVDDIAAEVGYDDPAFFRRLFKRNTNVTPVQYRRRFRFVGRVETER